MVLPVFRLMVRGPSTAAVQWKPIKARNKDPTGIRARNVAIAMQGEVSQSLASQNVHVVPECYTPVAYYIGSQKEMPQGLEVDLLIKIKIDSQPDRYAVVFIAVAPDHQETFKSASLCTCK